MALALVLGLGLAPSLGGCKPEPEPDASESLATLDADGPPHTPDCRSWSDLDYGSLPALPEGAHVAAFDEVWSTVAKKHFDPTLGCLDWPALRERYAPRVAEAGDDAMAAYVVINELLGLLGQSHLHATPPSMGAPDDDADSGPALVPVQVRWLPKAPGAETDVAVVVDAGVDDHDSGLPRGAILTGIGELSVAELAERSASAVKERGGSDAEVRFTIARAIGAKLACPVGGAKPLTFLDPRPAGEAGDAVDAERTVDAPCFVPEGERISLGNLRDLPTRVEWRMTAEGSKVGYLAFNYWMLPMVQRIRAGVETMRAGGMEALIIDLRGNPGGVGAMSVPVARLFVDHAVSLGRLQMRDFNQEFKVDANADAFAGPIVVLIDEGTASTSEIFAVGMADIGRVRVIGAGPSAGMALPSLIETLPDGGLIQYVVGDYHSTKGTVAEGEGVPLSARIEESRADYAAGKDPVLDAGIAELEAALAGGKAPALEDPPPESAP